MDVLDEDESDSTKIGHSLSWDTPNEHLLFCRQIGLRWARCVWDLEEPNIDAMRAVQERFEGHGIRIHTGMHATHRSLKIQLGWPGRDEDIETYRTYLRCLGKLGIPVSEFDFHPANTYTTSRAVRRGYDTRVFDVGVFRRDVEKQRFDREYSSEEIWGNFAYFLEAILPVAEEEGVRLALHPDDPPLATMNGVAKLFVNYDGYRRAEEIADGSEHFGIRLCVGTWAEGGQSMGRDVFEMIRDFGGRDRLFDIDFRNVSSTLPRFEETFLDDGYLDMYRVMKALREVRYGYLMVPDHIPGLAGDDSRFKPAGLAYSIAVMRTLLGRAVAEVG